MEPRSPLNSRRSRIRSVEPQPARLFRLAEEPNERQRKSYNNETRLMSPSPLVILPINPQAIPPSVQGAVQVKIVSETGSDEDDSMLQGNSLVFLTQEHRAEFFLKLVKTSKKKFRLKFTVQYQSSGQNFQEIIYSLPFGIITTKKNTMRRPELINMHLKYGLADRENEVWIKGKNFSARNTMEVMFGDRPANILETDENLIMCIAPSMPVEPGREFAVNVRVSNIDPKDGKLECEQSLVYIYCGPQAPTPIKEEISQGMPFQLNWNTEATDRKSVV